MENPIKMDYLGGFTPLFLVQHPFPMEKKHKKHRGEWNLKKSPSSMAKLDGSSCQILGLAPEVTSHRENAAWRIIPGLVSG